MLGLVAGPLKHNRSLPIVGNSRGNIQVLTEKKLKKNDFSFMNFLSEVLCAIYYTVKHVESHNFSLPRVTFKVLFRDSVDLKVIF